MSAGCRLGILLVTALTAACAVGPNYKRPGFETTPAFKEEAGWKPTEPADAVDHGPWWKIFNDAILDALEQKIDISNQNVKAAAAAVDEARALVSQAKSEFFPTIGANAGRTRGSAKGGPTLNTDSAGVTANWNLDIWGQTRRTLEADIAAAQGSVAALALTRLTAQGDLATDYFALRAQDQLQRLLDDTVAAQERSLKIAESRYRYGVAAKADVVSAQAQLLSSQAQQVNAKIQRAVLEHAVGPGTASRVTIFAGDVVPAKKPDPAIYLLTLDRLGLDPRDTLAVEDSRNGLLAADRAGLACLVTVSGYTREESFGEAVRKVLAP